MTGVLLSQPLVQQLNSNANPISGAAFYFHLTGTTTPTPVYADVALATPLTNPVVADAAGRLPAVYLDPLITYRLIIKSATGGTTIIDLDPITSGTASGAVTFTASGTGAVTRSVNDRLDDTVCVLDYIPRAYHAAIRAGTSTQNVTAYAQAALTAAANRRLYWPSGLYNVTQISTASPVAMFGDGGGSCIKQIAATVGDMITSTAGGQVVFQDLQVDGNEAAQSAASVNCAISCVGDGIVGGLPATVIMERVLFTDTVYGARVAGDTVYSTLESATFTDCRWLGGREGSGASYAPANINASDGVNISVTRPFMNLGHGPVASGRCGIFIGAGLTAFDGDNNLTIEDGEFYNLGCAITQTLGVIDFYWRGSNVSIRNNRFYTSLTSPVRGKTNGGRIDIRGNKIFAPDPGFVGGAITINAPQEYLTRPDYLISDNAITGYASVSGAVVSVTGLSGDEVKGVVCQNNAFIGCTGSLLYQFQYLNAPKIIGGRSDGCGSIVKILGGCIGKFTMQGGDYKVVTGAYAIDETDVSITSALDTDILDVNIEHTAAGTYAIFLAGGSARVSGGSITGACSAAITSRDTTLLSVTDVVLSTDKTVGVAPTAAVGGSSVDINVRNVRAPGATTNAFLPGSPSGVVTNEGNSWNYAATLPTNANLPIGTKVWNTAVVAGGAPGWVRVSGAYKAMAAVAA